ncbi:Uncharacterised protein [Mycobacteroides abscessus subsp. abscessus]|nr:Uncharacterised protein [Mycobacteroides abscessus subsp. abscessus]
MPPARSRWSITGSSRTSRYCAPSWSRPVSNSPVTRTPRWPCIWCRASSNPGTPPVTSSPRCSPSCVGWRGISLSSSLTRTTRAPSWPRAGLRRWLSASVTARCSSGPTSRRSSNTPGMLSNWGRIRSSSSPRTDTASPISRAMTTPGTPGCSPSIGICRPRKRAVTSTSCSRRSPNSRRRFPTPCWVTSISTG